MNADGTSPINLSHNGASDTEPTWSPDGTKIAFVSDRAGGGGIDSPSQDAIGSSSDDIFVMNADGTNPINVVNKSPGFDGFPSWSPDGTKIAFVSYREQSNKIYVMNADGTNPISLFSNDNVDTEPAWSPDGTKIAFVSGGRVDLNTHIYVVNADGMDLTRLTVSFPVASGPNNSPSWSPDGTTIAFEFRGDILVMNADGTNLTQLTQAPESDGSSPSWSPFFREGGTVVLEEQTTTQPQVFALEQNYPNPFNSDTVIRFALPTSGSVDLTLYNIAGQKMGTLVQGPREAGTYAVRWDSRDERGRDLSSGIYFYRLQIGEQVMIRKLLLLR
ncbi:MAG: Dipeptidyl-peptidase 5 [Nitrosomonadaceae bacterium]|nr:Dipeptidyl-peptidase 5 [Nitrosomonadaceae bacterium]